MPTTEERREVAAKLRKLEAENHWERSRFIVGFIDALGLESRANVGECLLHLADLIEPQERVCEVAYDESGCPCCGECGCVLYSTSGYCPNCGCRIKESA